MSTPLAMPQKTALETPELIEYPTRFALKVVGVHVDHFHTTIVEVVQQHVPDLNTEDVIARLSAQGNYMALTVTVTAQSREHLDGLYRSLSSHPLVKWVL